MVLVISDYYPSQATLEVKIYRRLSDAESADLHQRWRTRMRPDRERRRHLGLLSVPCREHPCCTQSSLVTIPKGSLAGPNTPTPVPTACAQWRANMRPFETLPAHFIA